MEDILEWVLKECDGKMKAGFFWFRIGTTGDLL
jgi:hypothetical protein